MSTFQHSRSLIAIMLNNVGTTHLAVEGMEYAYPPAPSLAKEPVDKTTVGFKAYVNQVKDFKRTAFTSDDTDRMLARANRRRCLNVQFRESKRANV